MISTDLQKRWRELLPGHDDLGADLLARYAEPHRAYHTGAHLLHLLIMIDELAAGLAQPVDLVPVRLAAWFHDSVYDVAAAPDGASDEERSARLAEERLSAAGVDPATTREVARLVRLTAGHDPEPDDLAGALLSDADMAILAAEPESYGDYARAIRQEYPHLDEATFAAGRSAFLAAAIDTPIFVTPPGRQLAERARVNLIRELGELSRHPAETEDDHRERERR